MVERCIDTAEVVRSILTESTCGIMVAMANQNISECTNTSLEASGNDVKVTLSKGGRFRGNVNNLDLDVVWDNWVGSAPDIQIVNNKVFIRTGLGSFFTGVINGVKLTVRTK